MQTLKIPFKTSSKGYEIIKDTQLEYSKIIRSAYCRFMDGMSESEVRKYLAQTFGKTDSWFVQSSIYEGKGMAEVDKNQNRTRIFGDIRTG